MTRSRRARCAMHPFDLVGVDVRRRDLDRRRQVEDALACAASAARRRVTASQISLARSRARCIVNVSGEYSKRQSRPGCCAAQFANKPRAGRRDVDDPVLVLAVDDPTKQRRRRRCTDGRSRASRRAATRTCARISSSRDCVSTWIVTSSGIRSSSISLRTKSKSVCEADGKADLDLLEADRHELPEHAQLALRVHRLDQRLVAVAQVRLQPDRRPGDRARGPRPVGKVDRRKRAVFLRRIGFHGGSSVGR